MLLLPLTTAISLLMGTPVGEVVSEPASRAVSLDEARSYARAHQPAIRAALARLAAQLADARVPRNKWFPVAGASAQLFGGTANDTSALLVPSPVASFPRIGATGLTTSPGEPGVWSVHAATFAGVGIGQEVYDFGRIAAQAAVQDALVDLEQGRADAERLDVDFNVDEAYFAVLAAKGILKAASDSYQRALAHRDLAKAGVAAQLRDPIELTRAEAELYQAETRVVRARGGLEAAQAGLAAAVGMPDLRLDASGTPPEPGEVPSLAAALDRIASHDPRLKVAVADLKAQQETTRAVTSELLPDIHLTASLSGRAGGAPSATGEVSDTKGWLPDIPNWDVGLVLTIPLFDAATLARRSAAEQREEEKAAAVDQVKLQETELVQRAFVSVGVARAALPGLQKSVEAARANYAQADARFGAGLGNSVELADAEALRTQAEIELALGNFELARSRAALARATAETL